MAKVDPRWSLDALLREFRPHPDWRHEFGEAYRQAMESAIPEEQQKGWKRAAMCFGDMHACVLCLFVCFYRRSLGRLDGERFQGHINICLLDMGLAVPVVAGPVPVMEAGKPETFHRQVDTFEVWMGEQLQPFAGDLRRAAEFSMRLAAIRLNLLIGPSEPSIDQMLDATLWKTIGLGVK